MESLPFLEFGLNIPSVHAISAHCI
jgi:hypothetical protein